MRSLIGILVIGVVSALPFTASGNDAVARVNAAEQRLLNKTVSEWHRHNPGGKLNPYETMLRKQSARLDSLILQTDRDATDVVLRRTAALLKHLKGMAGAESLEDMEKELDRLSQRNRQLPVSDKKKRGELYVEACTLRRKVSFANPLLNFKKIVFLARHRAKYNHMVDQYFGYFQNPGGGIYILSDPFSDDPKVVNLLAKTPVVNGRLKDRVLKDGSFLSLDLDYDGKTIAFAWTEAKKKIKDNRDTGICRWFPESTFHIFRATVDGKELRQLTDGIWNEFDPCFMPDGRIVFISERRGGHVRCSQRPDPCYTLFGMDRDGSSIRNLSYHDTNEWHPSVDNDGMLIYSRWDYVDRSPNIAHHLWITDPEGCDPRSRHGNYPKYMTDRTFAEMYMRAIPDSHKYMAVAVPHHGQAFGSLVTIDQRIEDNNAMSQVRRVTPHVPLPEADVVTRGYRKVTPRPPASLYKRAEVYASPWPLDEDFYLCSYDAQEKHYGVYLVDSFGNREFLYHDPKVGCLDPIPLRPRPRPPVVPSKINQSPEDRARGKRNMGTIAIMNIYDSDFKWPKDTRIRALRVIQLFPRPNYRQWLPNIGAARQSMARGVLGTVAVETDGSAHFEAPAGKQIYFQALDENGLAVQSMRSGTYLHAGERLSCVGCHENKWRPPRLNKTPAALQKPPQKLKPDVSGSYPVCFPVLVQPVLDRKCLPCHEKEKKAPNLSGALSKRSFPDNLDGKKAGLTWGWSEAMHTLAPLGFYQGGRTNAIHLPYDKGGGARSIAGKFGARASKLYAMLKKGHNKVKLTDEEMHRITLWLDTNCVFFGAYRETKKQLAGELIMPKLE